jgi:hypothetical protein
MQWALTQFRIDVLHMFISGLVCETVISFAAVQILYFVFTLRRHFMLLNSSLNEVVMSTVKSDNVLSLKFRKMSDCVPKRYSVISGLRDILYRHVVLCDVLELINSAYSLQGLAFIGSKFVHATVILDIFFIVLFDRSEVLAHSFFLLPDFSFEIIQLVAVVYCCKSACDQVGVIYIPYIWNHFVRGIWVSDGYFTDGLFVVRYFVMSISDYE